MMNELEHLFNLSMDMLAIVDAHGVFLRVNPSWQRTLGYSTDEMEGQPFMRFVYAPDVPSTEAMARRIIEERQTVVRFQNRYVGKDGSLHWLSWNATADHEIGRMYCVARDITYAKQTEMQLMLRNRAIEASPFSIVIADMRAQDTPLIYVNPAFERMTGYRADEVIGRNCRFLQGDDRQQPGVMALRVGIREERPITVVLRNYRRNGEQFYNELSLAPIHDEDGTLTHYVGISNDVTMRVLADEKIQYQNQELVMANYELASARQEALEAALQIARQNEQLRTANQALAKARREAEDATRLKSQFLATMSHELRTPLNAIIGYTEIQLAGMAGTLTDEQRDYQGRVLVNADHLLQMINDVLDISKIEAGRLEIVNKPFDLQAWLEEVTGQTQGLAREKALAYSATIDPRLPRVVVGDAARLKQVALNLLSNAIKFTDEGFVRVQARKHGGDAWTLTVEDSGIGIPSHMLETVFEEFRQVDSSSQRKQGGTGLGLAIVRKLVLMMGGTIRVQSQVGKGTTFTCILPLQVPHEATGDEEVKG
mgnify:CR=1 FL=1